MRSTLALLAAAALATAGCGGGTSGGHTTSTPARASEPNAAAPPQTPPPGRDFVRTIDNPWFPLEPGTVYTPKGEDESTPATDVLRVTDRTQRILGIRATVIDDRVYKNGRI